MKIIKNKDVKKGPNDWFTGDVDLTPLFGPITEEGKVSGSEVSFTPGARTAWHTHPLGQTLLVIAGKGWIQVEGEEKQEMNIGDVVQIAPEEKHWHGATDTDAMTHIAIQEAKDGRAIDWLEHVSDEDYKS